jgi:large conductance mechanosensitive channel
MDIPLVETGFFKQPQILIEPFAPTFRLDLGARYGILPARFPTTSAPGAGPPSPQEQPMSFMSEFKEFAIKGNVIDLAVGVIIGGAFGKIVDSIVGDLIMPVVGKLFGGLDFSSWYLGLAGQPSGLPLAEARKLGAVFAYGNFITVALNFAILAFIIFLMIKQINRLKNEAPAPAPAATPEDVMLLREIRDALKK